MQLYADGHPGAVRFLARAPAAAEPPDGSLPHHILSEPSQQLVLLGAAQLALELVAEGVDIGADIP
jgi:hypothetical protein